MLGEVAGRQLGEAEWGAEGGEGGSGPAPAPACPPPHPQREGRWPLGNWAAVGRGQGKPKLNTGWALIGSQGVAGGFSGGGQDPAGVIQATARRVPVPTDTECRVVPVLLPRPLVRTSSLSLPTAALQGGPVPRQTPGGPREGLNLAKTLAFSEG